MVSVQILSHQGFQSEKGIKFDSERGLGGLYEVLQAHLRFSKFIFLNKNGMYCTDVRNDI